MNLGEAAIRYKTITMVLTILILGGGILAYEQLGRLEDPEFTIKSAIVITPYPGASPEEVELEVSDKVEEAIQKMGQLWRIRSLNQPGLSIVRVDIKKTFWKKQLPQIWDELRRKVQDVQSQLPPGAGTSLVNDDFGDVFGVLLAITGEGYSYQELKDYADYLKRELSLMPDVAKIEFWGDQEERVFVEISRARLATLGIAPETIYATLQRQNQVVDAGRVTVGEEFIRINPTGTFQSVEEIGNLLIRGYPSDNLIYLKDVATISRGYVDPPRQIMRYNGKSAIGLGISTVSGGNVVTMGKAVEKRLQELEVTTPVGIEVGRVYYQPEAVNTAVDGFLINLLESLAIVIGVLIIFMGWRSGFLIGAILLLTIFATFAVMNIWQINLQRISLGALIIALGMLVDNAIVVTEGIMVRMQRGIAGIKAAGMTVSETIWPLLGATLVAILAFTPIGLSPDDTGEYCKSLFQVVGLSLFLSWVLAVTVTPLFCTMFLKSAPEGSETDPYGGLLFQGYKAFLRFCLRFRWLVMGVMLGLLILSIYGFGFIESSFFPDSTTPLFMIHIWLPEGTDIRETSQTMQELETYLIGLEKVTAVTTFVGAGALRFILTYTAEASDTAYGIFLVSVADYRVSDTLWDTTIRPYIEQNYPDVLANFKKLLLGPGEGAEVEAQFRGPDPVVLRQLTEQAKEIMRRDPDARDVRDDWRQPVKVIRPQFREIQARQAGVSRPELNHTLKRDFLGIPVGVYREADKLIPIIVRPPENERVDVTHINDLQVWSPVNNQMVPIRQIVSEIRTEWDNAIIRRYNRVRAIRAQADPRYGLTEPLRQRIAPAIEALSLPIGYEMTWMGRYFDSQEAQTALAKQIPGALILMVLTVVCLYNALRQPLIIWLTVPFAIVGVSAGLLATGLPFGFMPLLGFLSLSGMLIKNAIVLIEQIDLNIGEGQERFQAILEAAISRLRPVTMAASTTVLGMIPLILDAFYQGMAVTICAGLTFATTLTLIMVPVLYAIFFRIPWVPVQAPTQPEPEQEHVEMRQN
jgi:multidrug efflux pump subunit AcrB